MVKQASGLDRPTGLLFRPRASVCKGEEGLIVASVQLKKAPSQTYVAPWCYKWVDEWVDWISPGGG